MPECWPSLEVIENPIVTEVTIEEIVAAVTVDPINASTEVVVIDAPVTVEQIVAEYSPAGVPGPPGVGIPEVFVDGSPATLNFVPLGDGTYGLEVTA